MCFLKFRNLRIGSLFSKLLPSHYESSPFDSLPACSM